jgi:hypothetical protein
MEVFHAPLFQKLLLAILSSITLDAVLSFSSTTVF